MNLMQRYKLKPLFITLLICLGMSLLGGLVTPTPLGSMMQLGLALFVYCILPGYFLLMTVKIDTLEQIVLSIAVSISVISTTLYLFDFFDWKISLKNTVLVIVCCVLIGVLFKEKQSVYKLWRVALKR